MFHLLGTPTEHKQQIFYDIDHVLLVNEFFKETLAWLALRRF